ncbi:GtrA family protein [Tuwongella immobilis]|uniref:GtrA/DPMS transmembrane domain-containing protein n=1 Tax=Tuwongella immobilis TaxID=692036 RepID=A0A6C2YS41_9BACT|nr:GtrA family protein [Tuwongella immobilis]VIP03795.1 ribulose-phosphate 3-epimerase : Ribulose-phosphate 3-epimerase OS=Pirellula staleyi (strain ATCC 27377 / DSM 6068 / ICPB 4128) GN=Psta_4572 PE=4 SV=1: GtrA: Ribul_P_3_epim [Tuwongella immobilis]VTS04957.1 ribulose-phosphate 3-epimerase : Ribulose-phosphate 3-epimerase OS=Pirellula staleyi (strain ATCC 27377 / DSM 6068 / ICPB 4128) GN=Psta_4572 PE=4 SV=1: GtrA: Ribul_P_3_epim [Tuwongella immobilis]
MFQPIHRLRRQIDCLRYSRLSYYAYRHRYLAKFAAIGVFAIVLEIMLVGMMPPNWGWVTRAFLAFLVGLSVSYSLNALVNFQVPKHYFWSTFARYALVSLVSFTLNMAAVTLFRDLSGQGYGWARLVSAGVLFLFAYALHRRFTFDQAREFGIAVYATPAEKVARIFRRVGYHCDHIHVDLVDETMNPHAAPVDLRKLRQVRRLWGDRLPVALHVMSTDPQRWLKLTWEQVDWYLLHANTPNLLHWICECRIRGKKVGIVWHESCDVETMFPLLPHVDFVMILGIGQPGVSGQPMNPRALQMAEWFDSMRSRYGYEVMFDGSVNTETIGRIRARYVVAASAVLQAMNPVRVIHVLKTGAKYEQRGAQAAHS